MLIAFVSGPVTSSRRGSAIFVPIFVPAGGRRIGILFSGVRLPVFRLDGGSHVCKR
jgi:hypothetical protein